MYLNPIHSVLDLTNFRRKIVHVISSENNFTLAKIYPFYLGLDAYGNRMIYISASARYRRGIYLLPHGWKSSHTDGWASSSFLSCSLSNKRQVFCIAVNINVVSLTRINKPTQQQTGCFLGWSSPTVKYIQPFNI